MKKALLSAVLIAQGGVGVCMAYAGSSVPGIFGRGKKTVGSDTTVVHSSYDKLVSGAERRVGLFDVLKKGGDYYFAIPSRLLGKDMLVVNKLTRVPKELNEAGVNRGVNYENKMIRLEWDRQANKLLVREQRPLPQQKTSDAISRAVRDNYISPLIASLKLEAISPDSTYLVVKVNGLYDGSESSINNVFDNINLGTSAIKDLSRIQTIKSFDSNVVAYSELSTRVREGNTTANITVEVSSSIMILPTQAMPGRRASSRVGYFTVPQLAYYDNQQGVETYNWITRWRLEPRPEDRAAYLRGELVRPAKPIVFYIDNSTPRPWRRYIKEGIEEWQSAFEQAGFKEAIVAREVSLQDSIDVDDVSYSVLTYVASEKKNAMGPSLLDPRSGEILEADIIWWHNVMSMLKEWIAVQMGPTNPEARLPEIPESLMGEAIRFVACHEVGHSLGLRHNMIASNAYPTDSLRSPSFMARVNSTAASIMDYARFNYVAQPGDGVRNFVPHIGAYDRLAIEYGYRWYGNLSEEEEWKQLAALLVAHRDKQYRYSEAQDSRDAVDPRAQTEDLGDDPTHSSRLGIANLKRIVPHILEWTTTGEPGQSYDKASELYYAVIYQWNNYLYHVLANIGGIYIDNTTVGDGQETYRFVERSRQLGAMHFLIDEVLTYPQWLFDAEVGKYTFLLRSTPNGVQENAPSQILRNTQAYILWDMLSNNRLVRMLENEARQGNNAFTIVELMEGLHQAIFGVTERGGIPDVWQRSLQKNFLDALMTAAAESEGVKINKSLSEGVRLLDRDPFDLCSQSATNELYGEPRKLNFYGSQLNRISDAISVKRGELLRVKKLLQSRLSGIDRATRYHYEDMILRINTALGLR